MDVRTIACGALLVLLLARVGLADKVVLTNGNEFEGTILEDSKRRVVIKVRGGSLTFPRHLVKSVAKEAVPAKKEAPPDAAPNPGEGGRRPDGSPGRWGAGTSLEGLPPDLARRRAVVVSLHSRMGSRPEPLPG